MSYYDRLEVSSKESFLTTYSSLRHISLLARPRNEPLQDGVKIGFFLRTNAVAANLAVRNGFQVQRLYKLIDRELVCKVGFVAQNEQRYTF
jgi:hypothetical protein